MKQITKEDIVFIEYDGIGRPFQVFTKDLEGYDAFYKDKQIQCAWSSSGINPFLNELINANKKRNIWFKESFRPTNNSSSIVKILSDINISEMGYKKIGKARWIDETVDAINNHQN